MNPTPDADDPPPDAPGITIQVDPLGAGPATAESSAELGMVLASGVVLESLAPPVSGSTVDLAGKTPPRPAGPPPPRDFGKYELLGEIGRGGMGVVYKARHKELDRVVAIKMILASHLATDDQVDRFYYEARAAAKLTHPQIVGIHDVGQTHGQHYFAMDFVGGPSLARVVADGPVDPTRAAHLVYSVARAVSHLHGQGIVHRDLKPSNVLLDEEGRPRVTDFGLAKMLQADGRMTRTGAIVGTPGYMAPEQAAGRGEEVGPLSDVYALGAILYELLTGRPPFQGETPLDTLVQVLEGEPPLPSRLRPGIPRALELICLKCLERSPHDRYASAAALAEDLDHFLRGEQVEARRRGLWQHLRRWARSQPALASRLGTMGICGAIIQTNNYVIQYQNPPAQRGGLTVVVLWALASVAFQAMLNRGRWAPQARLAWAAADVVLYTILVQINDGLSTSLVAGYFLLVAASGLWFREHLVGITTGMAVAGYGVLVLSAGVYGTTSTESPYRHVVFVAALAVSGLITGYQVKRVRALSQYYETRPLP
jgi:serine/threonine-protein kinase